jgi:hypothetical protein
VYFEDNPDAFYIAPVSLSLSENPRFAGTDKSGNEVSGSTLTSLQNLQSLTPDAQGDQMGIWYSAQNQINENTILSYQGHNLDTQIFQQEYYTRVDLSNFQPLDSNYGAFGHSWYYPSVQLNLDVYVYVVGEWKTYQQPSDYPEHLPSPITSGNWNSFSILLNGIGSLLGLGEDMGWLVLIIMIAAASIIIIYYFKSRNSQTTNKTAKPTSTTSNMAGLNSFDWLIIIGLGALAFLLIFFTPGLPDDLLLGALDVGYFWYRTRQKK